MCEHPKLEVRASLRRGQAPTGEVTFDVDIRFACADCKTVFGVSGAPDVSDDRETLYVRVIEETGGPFLLR